METGNSLGQRADCRSETAKPNGLSFLQERMGSSKHIQRVFEQVRLVAPTHFTVLITGETGSGKELVAQAIHRTCSRQGHPFVPVDCGSIPSTLIETELFGHEKGSFTGADRMQLGKFEVAAGGTLFLDEISNLPFHVQPKLLRALQEKQIWRVGGTRPIEVNTRLVVACNQDLGALVQAERFRRDLYHRLNEFCITVPPLRERLEDIAYLAKRFIGLANEELNKSISGLSEAAMGMLLSHAWPGNVRELRNVIRRAVLLADAQIEPDHLYLPDTRPKIGVQTPEAGKQFDGSVPLKEIVHRAVMEVERKVLLQVLKQTGGNKAEAARILKLDYKTIHNKVKNYGITFAAGASGHAR